MRTPCLVIDYSPDSLHRWLALLQEIPTMEIHSAQTLQETASVLLSHRPKIIILHCGDSEESDTLLLQILSRLTWKFLLIPILSQPIAKLIDSLMHQKFVVDILTDHAERPRIEAALQKAFTLLTNESKSHSYFRGFIGFVGIIPALRERKILSEAGIGSIQNRSLRLAIDYWRKNPDSQIIGVAFNPAETFTTRQDELLENWEKYDLKPWEYGLYEAQRHYMDYWCRPIQEGLLPPTISTLVRESVEDMTPIHPESVQRILVKVGNMTRKGSIQEIFETMGVTFRIDDRANHAKKYEDFIHTLEMHMKEVDQKYPELTRPPDETGYEDFIPDIARANLEDAQRMAFQQKKR